MKLRTTPTLLMTGLFLLMLLIFTACIAPIRAPSQAESTSTSVDSTDGTTPLSSVTVIGGDEAALRTFVEQWMTPIYPGAPATQVTITVGALPSVLPVALSLPPTLTVIGAIELTGDYANTELLFTTAQDGETILENLRQQLEVQGFTPSESSMGASTRGFQSTDMNLATLCAPDNDISANLFAGQGRAGMSHIRLSLSLEQPSGPCSPPSGPEQGQPEILPILKAPTNAIIRSQGSGYGGDEAEVNAEIESTEELAVLVDHYAAQLEENGWQQLDASATEDIAWSAWTTTDDQDKIWNATFYILPRAGEEDTYLATLKLKRQR